MGLEREEEREEETLAAMEGALRLLVQASV